MGRAGQEIVVDDALSSVLLSRILALIYAYEGRQRREYMARVWCDEGD